MSQSPEGSELFASIAALTIHDVKNNLARLANEAELRGDQVSLQVALKASQSLTALLCFYKSENHMLDPQIDAQDPHELISNLLTAHPRSAESQAQIAIELELELAPHVWFYDNNLIQMVLANALQNALRFAHSQIKISVIAQAQELEICVQDDGNGYPQSVLDDTDSASSISREGTGLGLRLAQRVMGLHENAGRQGRIVLSNQNGARFQLFLP